MSTTILPEASTALDDARLVSARVEGIRTAVADLIASQMTALERGRDELRSAGIDAHIVTYSNSGTPHVGNIGTLWERYMDGDWCGRIHEYSFSYYEDRPMAALKDDRRGAYVSRGQVSIHHGPYEIIAIGAPAGTWEPQPLLIAKHEDVHDAYGHRRAIARLRTLARGEQMRVQTRDREVSLVNPMNTVVHVGDVTSATLWLMAMEPTGRREITLL